MQKQLEFLKNVLKAMGVTLTPEQTTALEAAQNEDSLTPFYALAQNSINSFGANQKNLGRSEVYDEVKSTLKTGLHGDDFDDNFFSEFTSKKGKDAFSHFATATKSKIEELKKAQKKASKEGDDKTSETLQAQIAQLNQQIAQAKQQQTEAIASKDSEIKSLRANSSLAFKVLGEGNLVDSFRNEQFIFEFLTPQIMKAIEKDGLKLSDDLSIVDQNGTPKFGDDNKPLSVQHFISKVAEPYSKKSDTPPAGSFSQGGNPPAAQSAFGAALAGGAF